MGAELQRRLSRLLVSGCVLLAGSPLPAQTQHWVKGVVVYPSGVPAQAAEVSLVRVHPDRRRQAVARGTTGRAGGFRLPATSSGQYDLGFKTKDMHVAVVHISISAGDEETDVGTIKLRPLTCSDEGVMCEDFGTEGPWALTVCEVPQALKMAGFGFTPLNPGYLVGRLVRTKTGTWLRGPCGDALAADKYTWPNAIALVVTPFAVHPPPSFGDVVTGMFTRFTGATKSFQALEGRQTVDSKDQEPLAVV